MGTEKLKIINCWITTSGGISLYSLKSNDQAILSNFQKSGNEENSQQLIAGLITAMVEFAQTLGTNIKKIDFDKESFVVFQVYDLRVSLLVDKSATDSDIEYYREMFQELYIRHYDLLKESKVAKPLKNTAFERDLKENLQLIPKEKVSPLTRKIGQILDNYKMGTIDKNQAAEELVKMAKKAGFAEESLKNVKQLKRKIKTLNIQGNQAELFISLINAYEFHVKKALDKLKSSLFR
ncbi:MAG: hypothetical protein GF308_19720 [Candidatus Heimdallarchaeota archaeon]|nr:hypothetical protein [Candidatus Heimdallarchaeota archaeon]